MAFKGTFPPIETALDMEPEELAPFVLRDLASRGQSNINRYNYGLGNTQDFVEYVGQHRERFLEHLMEAWIWLEREQLLAPRPGTQGEWMFVTRRGFRLLESQDFRAYAKEGLLPQSGLDPVLSRKVRPLFIRGDYDTAVFQALKEVEVRVRQKAGLGNDQIGVTLMRAAFRPDSGPLTDKTTEPGEQVATMELFAGAVGRFKNPASHRDVAYTEPEEVADIIRISNQLLRVLDRLVGPGTI